MSSSPTHDVQIVCDRCEGAGNSRNPDSTIEHLSLPPSTGEPLDSTAVLRMGPAHSRGVADVRRRVRFAFPLGAATGETVWTLINRNNTARGGAQLLPLVQGTTSRPLHFFDCYRGVPLTPNGEGELSFTIAANGFGCVLATPTATVISPPPSAEALRLTGGAPAVPRRCLRHSATFSPPWHR